LNLEQNNGIIYLLDHLVKQSIINILLHHTMIPKSKFLSKFPISKWSFVNYELFKSPKLTKYIFLVNNFFATRLFSPSIQLFCVRKNISSGICNKIVFTINSIVLCEKNYLLKSFPFNSSYKFIGDLFLLQFSCFVSNIYRS